MSEYNLELRVYSMQTSQLIEIIAASMMGQRYNKDLVDECKRQINERFDNIKSDINSLEMDVRELKSDVRDIRSRG